MTKPLSASEIFDDYQLLHLKEIDSTHLEAKRILHSSNFPITAQHLVILADQQTAGKGRYGRHWISPEGNLYCTIALTLNSSLEQAPLFSFATAVALKEALKTYIENDIISYKWPNDILVEDKKIAGILIELYFPYGAKQPPVLLVGVGVNINSFPKGINYEATSLKQYCSTPPSKKKLLKDFLKEFEVHKCLLEQGKFSEIRQLWQKNAKGLGQEIEVRLAKKHYSGIFKELSHAGELVLLLKDGNEQRIMAGEVFFDEL